MTEFSLTELHSFIISAKSGTYVGGGAKIPSCRPSSHDLQFTKGEWSYLDSYFGGTDFLGQETVWHVKKPVWAMNYYGYILRPELITPSQAGEMIKSSLSRMYTENRFLGGFQHREGDLVYFDTSEGEFTRFTGCEWMERDATKVYELVYHGGLVKE